MDTRTQHLDSEPSGALERLSHAALCDILDAQSDLVCFLENGHIRHVNASGVQLLGATTMDQLMDVRFQDLMSDDYSAIIDDVVAVMIDDPDPTPLRIATLDGRNLSLNIRIKSIPDAGADCAVLLAHDLTRQVELSADIHQSEARFGILVDSALDLICVIEDELISYVNDAGMKLLKASSRDDVVGRPLIDFTHEDYKPMFTVAMSELADDGELIPARFVALDGSVIEAELAIAEMDHATHSTFMVEVRDITDHNRAVTALRQSIETLEMRVEGRTRELQDEVTERRRAEEKLRHVASHDGLTDLPNRTMLMDRLDVAVHRAHRDTNMCAVLFIDLDEFKAVNDSFGHEAGDVVLKGVAKRLKSCIRETDTAARFGGDEFILVLGDLDEPDDATVVAETVIAELSRPFNIGGPQAQIGASIGIAIYPDDATDPIELMKIADGAMYKAKDKGKNTYVFADAAT